MPPPEYLQLFSALGGLGVGGWVIWWSMNGRIRWEKSVTEQREQYERQIAQILADREAERQAHATEIARLEARNQQLWDDLREAVAVTRRGIEASQRAAAVTENVVRGQQ